MPTYTEEKFLQILSNYFSQNETSNSTKSCNAFMVLERQSSLFTRQRII